MTDIYPSRHAAAAEMRPRQDPVVHSEWSDDAPIGVEQAAQFDRDGYIVLEDLFSDDEVTFLQRAAGKLLADPSAPVSYPHLRAHETVLDLVCRLLLEKKKP